MSEEKQSFQAEVWQTLSAINVNEHTEQKQRLTYLSWAWAWGTLMNHYPESTYEFKEFPSEGIMDRETGEMVKALVSLPYRELPNGSTEVWITLNIKKGADSWAQDMWLPILDFKNKPVINPDSFALNSTRMRCLTKAMAMFGLGHYIYAGEDLPEADKKGRSVVQDVIDQSGLDQSDPRIRDYSTSITAALNNEDNPGLFELIDEMDNDMQVLVWKELDSKQRSKIKALQAERKAA